MSLNLIFTCPSCTAKLTSVEAAMVHTQVVTRTCRRCGDRWQLTVVPIAVRNAENRIDRATFAFKDNRWTRTKKDAAS